MSSQTIPITEFGEHQGQKVLQAVLKSPQGVAVSIISYGAILRDWQVPVAGKKRWVVLGYSILDKYLQDPVHIGAIVGRVANRIGGATFTLNDTVYKLPANVGQDHLHGGPKGISKQNWQLSTDEKTNSVILKLHSPAGDMGYPADVDFQVVYTLKGARLKIEMSASVSELTPISMVQHNYFNLSGGGEVYDHKLLIEADSYTVLSDKLVTTGEIRSVDNTIYDFREPRSMRDTKKQGQPYDINFVLNKERGTAPAAQIYSPDKSLTLKLWTDRPGLQLYNGQKTGVCLEDQMLPNAVNIPSFPSILASPEKPYSHTCEIEIK